MASSLDLQDFRQEEANSSEPTKTTLDSPAAAAAVAAKPRFDLGGVVSSYNPLASGIPSSGPQTDPDQLARSHPNLNLDERPPYGHQHLFGLKPHRSFLDRPLVALVMEPSSAMGLLDEVAAAAANGAAAGCKNSDFEDSSSGEFKSSFAKEVARGRKAASVAAVRTRYPDTNHGGGGGVDDLSPPPSPCFRANRRAGSADIHKYRMKSQETVDSLMMGGGGQHDHYLSTNHDFQGHLRERRGLSGGGGGRGGRRSCFAEAGGSGGRGDYEDDDDFEEESSFSTAADAAAATASSSLATSSTLYAAAAAAPSGNGGSDLWMTSTQFSQLLDKQEAAETNTAAAGNGGNSVLRLNFEKNGGGGGGGGVNRFTGRHSNIGGGCNVAGNGGGGKLFRRSSTASSVTSVTSSAFSRPTSFAATQNNSDSINGPYSSFLDNDAKIPFGKLKQNCKDLGFSFSESEWNQLRQMLFTEGAGGGGGGGGRGTGSVGVGPDHHHHHHHHHSHQYQQQQQQPRIDGSAVVRNGDFFSALEILMKDKHQQRGTRMLGLPVPPDTSNSSSRRHLPPDEPHHKYSMKSDSGGEMESCRSSDSDELLLQTLQVGGAVDDPDQTVAAGGGGRRPCPSTSSSSGGGVMDGGGGGGTTTSGGSPSPPMTQMMNGGGSGNLLMLGENLAEKETELLKVKMECKRLQEANAHLNQQLRLRKDKRTLELEKEVEHLKWQLSAMETSRRTYEEATHRLVTFLEQVTTVLQTGSSGGNLASMHGGLGAQRKQLMESTRAEISRVARRTHKLQQAAAAAAANKRLSLDSNQSSSLISRTESMPGLNFGLNGSLLSLSTNASHKNIGVGGGNGYNGVGSVCDVTSSSTCSSSHKSTTIGGGGGGGPKTSGSSFSSSTKTLNSNGGAMVVGLSSMTSGAPGGSCYNVSSGVGEKVRRRVSSCSSGGSGSGSKVQRSQSTHSKLPSVKERDYVNAEIVNDVVHILNNNNSGQDVTTTGSSQQQQQQKKHVCAIRIGGGEGTSNGGEVHHPSSHFSDGLMSSTKEKAVAPCPPATSNNDSLGRRVLLPDPSDGGQSPLPPPSMSSAPCTPISDGCTSATSTFGKKKSRKVSPHPPPLLVAADLVDQVPRPIPKSKVHHNNNTSKVTINAAAAVSQIKKCTKSEPSSPSVVPMPNPDTAAAAATATASKKPLRHSAVVISGGKGAAPPVPTTTTTLLSRSTAEQQQKRESKIMSKSKPGVTKEEAAGGVGDMDRVAAATAAAADEESDSVQEVLSVEGGGAAAAKMQVLVASNSNNPIRKSNGNGEESLNGSSNSLQSQTKFKSLGDLHMEKGLPATPRYKINKFLRKRLSFYNNNS